jgi:hypothetical protein
MCRPARPPGHGSSAMREPAPHTGGHPTSAPEDSTPRTGPSRALGDTSAPGRPERPRLRRPTSPSGHGTSRRLGRAPNPRHDDLLGACFRPPHPAEAVATASYYGKRRDGVMIESRRHDSANAASTHRKRTRLPAATAAIDGPCGTPSQRFLPPTQRSTRQRTALLKDTAGAARSPRSSAGSDATEEREETRDEQADMKKPGHSHIPGSSP